MISRLPTPVEKIRDDSLSKRFGANFFWRQHHRSSTKAIQRSPTVKMARSEDTPGDEPYRQAKEKFYQGHSGGSSLEVVLITAIPPASVLLSQVGPGGMRTSCSAMC
jgi:hypothetical protein